MANVGCMNHLTGEWARLEAKTGVGGNGRPWGPIFKDEKRGGLGWIKYEVPSAQREEPPRTITTIRSKANISFERYQTKIQGHSCAKFVQRLVLR